jgi:hypothetical protein
VLGVRPTRLNARADPLTPAVASDAAALLAFKKHLFLERLQRAFSGFKLNSLAAQLFWGFWNRGLVHRWFLMEHLGTKRFKVTENRERADAILKGVALEKSSQEVHAYRESTAVGGASGSHSGSVNGILVNGTGSVSGSSNGGFVAHHMGTSDSSLNTETVNEARVPVRLVNPDGDVIWTSTQESKGAKYKGSSADVADRCVKQLRETSRNWRVLAQLVHPRTSL